ncbi:MAG: 3'-5' exonuclease [Planctomycetes bacterium]|nr:3'-5' exonuclease [Planctomycetota bacterium]
MTLGKSSAESSLNFAAIDFETADTGRDSACAVGLVRVAGGKIIERNHFLIRPPRRGFIFTWLHGISWEDVENEPTFSELWPRLSGCFDGLDFLAAHNASFDRAVLRAACEGAGLAPPQQPFLCTVRLARRLWGIRPANLPNVCAYLGISLRHHDPLSDAEACARIVLAARKAGWKANESGVKSGISTAPRRSRKHGSH